ncbi:hypothetical protein B0H14DRAFT_2369257, partial [Mycena olivaceomarginata]
LCETYRKGDKVFLFGAVNRNPGFSRRAYQVRTLAGMIETIGLIHAGNDQIITFAYEIYSQRHKGKCRRNCQKLKKSCSRDVRIHFVGVWDTVSSVGIFRGKPLPLTLLAERICYICTFRHALALDEHRVKFLPEYVDRGCSHAAASETGNLIDVKEMWFAGVHSDILNLSSVPLLWMENVAQAAGLRLESCIDGGSWNLDKLQQRPVNESLTGGWKLLEYLPLTRLSFRI